MAVKDRADYRRRQRNQSKTYASFANDGIGARQRGEAVDVVWNKELNKFVIIYEEDPANVASRS